MSDTDTDPSQALQVQVLGLCRFSYLGEGGFQVEHSDLDARRRALYDPRRLAQRLAWFQHVTLPAVRAQTDPDFTLVILLGEDFPATERTLLETMTRGIPQIRFEALPPMRHRAACREALSRHIDPAADLVAQFRLDDDDAVAVDFVETLHRDILISTGIAAMRGTMAIDYQKGVVLEHGPDGLTAKGRFARYWTPALVVCLLQGDSRSILDFTHHQIWSLMPTVTFMDQIMFLRGAHGGNDSGAPRNALPFGQKLKNPSRILRDRFAIDLPTFDAALGHLA